ncbi:MAG TPA: tetratricopeptide repeat protein [Blastocatellia bacterium]|nr:tetratricopeptide repeat protein [Blastocatellia bacterium]
MSHARIDAFAAMTRDQPDNEMIWYGLASEYSKLGRWDEAAAALRQVIRIKPDYTAAYQMLGTALASLGEVEAARRAWESGVEVATRTGAWKARQHMEGLLAGTTPGPGSGLCP